MSIFTKAKAGFAVFQRGKAVANPENWKSKAKLGNVLTLFLGACLAATAAFGHDLPIGGETIELLAYSLAGLWIAGWRVYRIITREDKGLSPRSKPNH